MDNRLSAWCTLLISPAIVVIGSVRGGSVNIVMEHLSPSFLDFCG